ncbi:MAG: glycosyltransferase [bacterium]|nr:glycosyltransferase [bacterium]
MKILLLNDRYPPNYESSVANITKNLADAYAQKGHTVSVITSHRKDVSKDIVRTGNVISLPIDYAPSLRHYKSLKQSTVSNMLKQEMQNIQPDIVHAHNLHMYLTYDALCIARTFTDKVCITMHDTMSFNYGRLMTHRYLASAGVDTQVTPLDHIGQVGLQWNPFRNRLIRRILQKTHRK